MPVELLYYTPGPEAPRHLGYARDTFEDAVEALPKKYPVTHIGDIQFAFGEDLAGKPGIIVRSSYLSRGVASSVYGIMNLHVNDQRIHLEEPHPIRYRPTLVSLVHNLTKNERPGIVEQVIIFGRHHLPKLELDAHKFPTDLAKKRTDLLALVTDYLGNMRGEDVTPVAARSQYASAPPDVAARRSGAQGTVQ